MKKLFFRIKHIVDFPSNVKYLSFNKKVKPNGIVLVIHESDNLGASLLLLHTAKELVSKGKNVYIISLQFGELNDKYAAIAPIQVIFSKSKFKSTLFKLKHFYNYNKILMITAAVGFLTKTAHELNYNIVSEIHELPTVISKLNLVKMTKQMLMYSDKVVFSTDFARDEDLSLVGFPNNNKIIVRPQGTYFHVPASKILDSEVKNLIRKYPSISNKKVVIGVGNTSARKGFDIFVRVAEQMPQYLFLWAGKKEYFYNKVSRVNRVSNFIYLGQLSERELAAVYDVASVLLLTSRNDTLPSTIFEALLFKVPVIGARTSGGVADVVKDKKNGILINNTLIKNYVSAVKTIFLSETQRKINNYFRLNHGTNSFSDYISFILTLF